MLAIAAERSAGTHPYLTVPAQTQAARTRLGPGALIAPEQTVVADTDPDSARRAARDFLRSYLQLSNYTSNMRRAGFSADDIAGEGSDELVDRIVAHGDAASIAAAIRGHLDAGADHVCVQVQPVRSDMHSRAPRYRDGARARLSGDILHGTDPRALVIGAWLKRALGNDAGGQAPGIIMSLSLGPLWDLEQPVLVVGFFVVGCSSRSSRHPRPSRRPTLRPTGLAPATSHRPLARAQGDRTDMGRHIGHAGRQKSNRPASNAEAILCPTCSEDRSAIGIRLSCVGACPPLRAALVGALRVSTASSWSPLVASGSPHS